MKNRLKIFVYELFYAFDSVYFSFGKCSSVECFKQKGPFFLAPNMLFIYNYSALIKYIFLIYFKYRMKFLHTQTLIRYSLKRIMRLPPQINWIKHKAV